MDETQLKEILVYFDNKQKDCLVQKKAYDKWLGIITPLRWLAIAIGVVAPAILGANLSFGTFPYWKETCTIVLITSAIVSGLHTALKCDVHQQECLRLGKQYESLAGKFELAKTDSPTDIVLKKKELSDRYSELLENTLTTPAQWCIDRAILEVKGTDA